MTQSWVLLFLDKAVLQWNESRMKMHSEVKESEYSYIIC